MKVDQTQSPPPRSAAGGRRTVGRIPPQRDVTFANIELAELRAMRSGLNDEESKVSYWRRIVQARIDLLVSRDRPGERGEGLARILADSRASHRRLAALKVESVESLPPLPDLAGLWDRMIPDDPLEREELAEHLREAEARLSEYRHELHLRIDKVTGELIARYREDPTLALTALHERLMSH
ncbi:MAG: hypothetical protein U0R64_00905 [Candidatus Nanopelagicales bacterium]